MKGIKGFTLLEVVIALAIFVIGMVGILSLFPVSFSISKRATDLTETTIYAQGKIEELKNKGYDHSDLDPGTVNDVNFTDADGNSTRFYYDLTISTPSIGLKKLELTVKWTEGGKTYDEDFVTYMAKLTP